MKKIIYILIILISWSCSNDPTEESLPSRECLMAFTSARALTEGTSNTPSTYRIVAYSKGEYNASGTYSSHTEGKTIMAPCRVDDAGVYLGATTDSALYLSYAGSPYRLCVAHPAVALTPVGAGKRGYRYIREPATGENTLYVSNPTSEVLVNSGNTIDRKYSYTFPENVVLVERRAKIKFSIKSENPLTIAGVRLTDLAKEGIYIPLTEEFIRQRETEDITYGNTSFSISSTPVTLYVNQSDNTEVYILPTDYSKVSTDDAASLPVPQLIITFPTNDAAVTKEVKIPLAYRILASKTYDYTIEIKTAAITLSLSVADWSPVNSTENPDTDYPQVTIPFSLSEWTNGGGGSTTL